MSGGRLLGVVPVVLHAARSRLEASKENSANFLIGKLQLLSSLGFDEYAPGIRVGANYGVALRRVSLLKVVDLTNGDPLCRRSLTLEMGQHDQRAEESRKIVAVELGTPDDRALVPIAD